MKKDPIVKQIRDVRREIEVECGNDPVKFYKHVQAQQKRYGGKLVRGEPRQAVQAKSA